MKTTHNALALLFAAISFTACTNQSIEPVPQQAPSSQFVMYADSTSPVRVLPEKVEQPQQIQNGTVTVSQGPVRVPQQPHVISPSPEPMPRQTVLPVVKLDTLAQY